MKYLTKVYGRAVKTQNIIALHTVKHKILLNSSIFLISARQAIVEWFPVKKSSFSEIEILAYCKMGTFEHRNQEMFTHPRQNAILS